MVSDVSIFFNRPNYLYLYGCIIFKFNIYLQLVNLARYEVTAFWDRKNSFNDNDMAEDMQKMVSNVLLWN
tara:strand:- start:115231 stop:115440 length:210 start_codon:yes stop_codon:yes gene_type:complete